MQSLDKLQENSDEMAYELTTKNIWIISAVALFALFFVGGFVLKSDFSNPKIFINETPIYKNSQFQLKSGDTYDYSYVINGTKTNITYEIVDDNGCTQIRITNGMRRSSICVDKDGLDTKLKSNATLSDPSFLLFKPWMLALDSNWNWNNTLYLNFNNKLSRMTTNTYHVMRIENYNGRRTFVVSESDDQGINQYDWVDYQKRILVKASGSGYEITLLNQLN